MKFCNIITMLALAVGGNAMADINLYSEDFSGTPGTDYIGGAGNFSYGYDADGGGTAYKALNYGQWGSYFGAPSVFTNGIASPNPGATGSSRLIGSLLDPSLFSGYDGQTLTLHFDIVADSSGNTRNAFFWIYEASGYDTSGANDWHLDVADVTLTSGNPMDNSGGGATVTQLAKSDFLVTATSSTDNTLTFTYTEGTGIGLVFGSFGSDVAIDNVSITAIPEPATLGLITAFGVSVLFIRRLMM